MKAANYIRQGWTRYWYAKDELDKDVDARSPRAVCWCSLGAITAAYGAFTDDAKSAREKLRAVIGVVEIDRWNDAPERTQDDVIAAFEKAGI